MQITADLFSFTDKILTGKIHIICSRYRVDLEGRPNIKKKIDCKDFSGKSSQVYMTYHIDSLSII